MVSNPLATSLASSRCTAPEPALVEAMSSLTVKLRCGWPYNAPSTRCCVVVNNAPARPRAGCRSTEYAAGVSRTLRGFRFRECVVFVPIMGTLLPNMGICNSKRLPTSRQQRHAGSFGRALVERVGGPAAGIGRRYRDQGIGEFSVVLLELSEGSPDTFGTFDDNAAGAQHGIHNLLHA